MFYFKKNILISIIIFSILDGASQDKSFEVPDFCGETMHYRLKYGIFNIGFASISCLEDSMECGANIKAEAHSSGWVKIFKDLDYRFECCMDLATGLPNSSIRNLRDGRYNHYNKLIFDQYSRNDSAIVFSQISGKHVVQKNIHDILTGFYHFRENFISESVNNGEDVVIKTFFMGKIWDLRIRYSGEEIINTKYGQLACHKFNPVTVIGRYFHNDDDMSIWFSKDSIPIPVKIRLNLKIGSINSELVEYKKPKHKSSKLTTQEKLVVMTQTDFP